MSRIERKHATGRRTCIGVLAVMVGDDDEPEPGPVDAGQ